MSHKPSHVVLVKKTASEPFRIRRTYSGRAARPAALAAVRVIERTETNYACIAMDERDWKAMQTPTA